MLVLESAKYTQCSRKHPRNTWENIYLNDLFTLMSLSMFHKCYLREILHLIEHMINVYVKIPSPLDKSIFHATVQLVS